MSASYQTISDFVRSNVEFEFKNLALATPKEALAVATEQNNNDVAEQKQQNHRNIPIIFSGMRGNGQDIVRIFNPKTGKVEYWDQTLADIKKGSAPGRLAPALESIDKILSKSSNCRSHKIVRLPPLRPGQP